MAFFDQLLPRLRALPGVRAADAVMMLPLTGNNFNISFEVAGRPPISPALQPTMEVRVATPGYLSEMGIPLKRGRGFTDDDKAGTPPVVILTETSAQKFFPNEDPIGKTIKLGWGRGAGKPKAGGGVVRIVGDVKGASLGEPTCRRSACRARRWPSSR